MYIKSSLFSKLLTGLLITTLSIPMITNAAEINDELYTLDKELCLSSDTPYEKVTELGTTPLDKSFTCMFDYFDTEYMSVSVSASIDGKNPIDLYWSDTPYLLQSDETAYVAVMKADDTQTWSTDSNIIIKMEDVTSIASLIQIDMGASKEGPRDYRIEYSTDEGKTWKSFSQTGKTTLSVNSPQTIGTIFSENIDFIERDYTLKTCHEILPNGMNFVHDFRFRHDVYFKISVDSDYRADGTKGLLGSSQGEVAIQSIRLYEHAIVVDDSVLGAPENDANEETADTEINTDVKQPVSDNSTDAKQPVSDNSTDVKQPVSDNSTNGNQPGADNSTDGNQPEADNSTDGNQPGADDSTDLKQPGSDNNIQKEQSRVESTPETNQIQLNNNTKQPQSTTTQNPETSIENTTQPKQKASQKATVKQTKKTYTSSKLKKKSRSFSLEVSVKGDANVSYKKLSGSKKLSINKKTGKITIKKGTKKGTYKMKVKIKVAKTNEYQAKDITKTITVKVK